MEGLDFESAAGVQMPKGHELHDQKDFDKCPFAKMGGKMPADNKAKKEKSEKDANSDSEDDEPRGGCPVMTSGKEEIMKTRTRTPTSRRSLQTLTCPTSLR